jgi:hypothetical protein
MGTACTKTTNKKTLLELIEKNKGITNYSELAIHAGVHRTHLSKKKFTEDQDINEAIQKNCVNIKMSLKKKWYDSGNFSAELCLFKLLATKDERDALTFSKTTVLEESNVDGDSVVQYVVNRTVISKDEFEASKAASEKKS